MISKKSIQIACNLILTRLNFSSSGWQELKRIGQGLLIPIMSLCSHCTHCVNWDRGRNGWAVHLLSINKTSRKANVQLHNFELFYCAIWKMVNLFFSTPWQYKKWCQELEDAAFYHNCSCRLCYRCMSACISEIHLRIPWILFLMTLVTVTSSYQLRVQDLSVDTGRQRNQLNHF